MTPEHVTLPLAFVAGLLSFVSPCVLPLVPAYLGYLGGTAVLSAGERGRSLTPFLHSVLFVLGFSLVFVVLGASATFLGRLLYDYRLLLARVGGVLLVVFGLRLMGADWSRRRWTVAAVVTGLAAAVLASGILVEPPTDLSGLPLWLAHGVLIAFVVLAGAEQNLVRQIILAAAAAALNLLTSLSAPGPRVVESLLIGLVAFVSGRPEFYYGEKRLELDSLQSPGKAGSLSGGRSFLFGVIFAAGWTPCLGPILAAILLLASQLDTVGQGILLLCAYSLGLGIPFLVVGLAFGPLSGALGRMKRYLGLVSAVSGVLLVLMGLLLFTDSLTFLARYGGLLDL